MARRLDRTLLFHSVPHQTSPKTAFNEDDAVLATLTHNLTVDERHLWLALVNGGSVRDAAAKCGITRASVYRALRGTTKHPGGMITKNAWVARWWQARRSLTRS